MKTKIFLSISVAAIISLSFSFISIESKPKKVATEDNIDLKAAPSGGFVSEDKL